MNKKERLEHIRTFVTEMEVSTQEEIVEYLRKLGGKVTQATVSRDMKELGLIKVPHRDKNVFYKLPTVTGKPLKSDKEQLPSSDILGNMITLKLTPGSTVFVKNQIVERFADSIFSILADDDTILIIVRDEGLVLDLLDKIKKLVGEHVT